MFRRKKISTAHFARLEKKKILCTFRKKKFTARLAHLGKKLFSARLACLDLRPSHTESSTGGRPLMTKIFTDHLQPSATIGDHGHKKNVAVTHFGRRLV